MKKLLEKDKIVRKNNQNFEVQKFILKSINQNSIFFNLTCWKSNLKLSKLPIKSSKTRIVNRCIKTSNKKKFNKLTNFSRTVFFKLVKNKRINSIYKSSW